MTTRKIVVELEVHDTPANKLLPAVVKLDAGKSVAIMALLRPQRTR